MVAKREYASPLVSSFDDSSCRPLGLLSDVYKRRADLLEIFFLKIFLVMADRYDNKDRFGGNMWTGT